MLSSYLQFKDVIGYDSPDIIYLFNHPIFVTDEKLRVIGSNISAQEIVTEAFRGESTRFFENKCLTDVFDIDYSAQEFIRSVMKNEQYRKAPNYTFISKLVRTTRVYEGNCIPIKSMSGDNKILFCFLDKTDQLRNDEALNYKETLFDIVMDNSNDAVIVLSNREGAIELFNPSAEGLFGYSSFEILIETADILFDHDTWLRIQDALEHLDNSDASTSVSIEEAIGVNIDEDSLQLSLSLSKYQPEGRELYIISASDVSGFNALLDAMSDAYISFSEKGKVMAWNNSAVTILGWAQSDWLSFYFSDLKFMHSITGEIYENITDIVSTSEKGITTEHRHLAIYTKRGRHIPVVIKCWAHSVQSQMQFNFLISPLKFG